MFSRAWDRLHGFALSFDWFIAFINDWPRKVHLFNVGKFSELYSDFEHFQITIIILSRLKKEETVNKMPT